MVSRNVDTANTEAGGADEGDGGMGWYGPEVLEALRRVRETQDVRPLSASGAGKRFGRYVGDVMVEAGVPATIVTDLIRALLTASVITVTTVNKRTKKTGVRVADDFEERAQYVQIPKPPVKKRRNTVAFPDGYGQLVQVNPRWAALVPPRSQLVCSQGQWELFDITKEKAVSEWRGFKAINRNPAAAKNAYHLGWNTSEKRFSKHKDALTLEKYDPEIFQWVQNFVENRRDQ